MITDNGTGSIWEAAFKLLCGAFGALVTWVWIGNVDDMKALHKELASAKEDANNHKIYIEREFEKRETIQVSLSRIHDRLDKIFDLIQNKHK